MLFISLTIFFSISGGWSLSVAGPSAATAGQSTSWSWQRAVDTDPVRFDLNLLVVSSGAQVTSNRVSSDRPQGTMNFIIPTAGQFQVIATSPPAAGTVQVLAKSNIITVQAAESNAQAPPQVTQAATQEGATTDAPPSQTEQQDGTTNASPTNTPSPLAAQASPDESSLANTQPNSNSEFSGQSSTIVTSTGVVTSTLALTAQGSTTLPSDQPSESTLSYAYGTSPTATHLSGADASPKLQTPVIIGIVFGVLVFLLSLVLLLLPLSRRLIAARRRRRDDQSGPVFRTGAGDLPTPASVEAAWQWRDPEAVHQDGSLPLYPSTSSLIPRDIKRPPRPPSLSISLSHTDTTSDVNLPTVSTTSEQPRAPWLHDGEPESPIHFASPNTPYPSTAGTEMAEMMADIQNLRITLHEAPPPAYRATSSYSDSDIM